MSRPILKQFDQVSLLTTAHISWLSAPPGNSTTPRGIWTVVGLIGADAVLTKDQTTIRVPYTDVELKASYSLKTAFEGLKKREIYGERTKRTEGKGSRTRYDSEGASG